MGKKSLIKSTKKKSSPAKKSYVAKKAAAKASQKKIVSKKKAPSKTAAKKVAASTKKKVSLKDLIFKQFYTWKPEKIYVADSDSESLPNYTAPPFVSGSEEETKRIKDLLFLKFDLEAIRKQAAEKAAAEKAAAEKTAAKKAAAEKAATVKKAIEIRTAAAKEADEKAAAMYDDTKWLDRLKKAILPVVASLGLTVVLIVFASLSNINNYYINSTDDGIKILRGSFSPTGKKVYMTLPGVESAGPIKPVYSKKEIYPIISKYYLDKADDAINVSSIPDFNEVKSYIKKAISFGIDKKTRKAALNRLNKVDSMILLLKADIVADKETASGLKSALNYLNQAALLNSDPDLAERIDTKIKSIKNRIKNR